jgi:hypothetical protein
MSIRELIKSERDQYRDFERANKMRCGTWIMHEFLLRNGKEFIGDGLPAPWKLKPAKCCYENARNLCLEDGLRYWEGLTTWKAGYTLHGLLIAHAWCVDESGRVIDPTLSDTSGASAAHEHDFFGVEFTPRQLERDWDGAMLTGSREAYRLKVMLAYDPGMEPILRPFRGL